MGAPPPLFWLATSVAAAAEASAFVVVMAVGDTAGDDWEEGAAAAWALAEEAGKCPGAALSDLGCAKRTPWYITELISSETTSELSPESPGCGKREGELE